MGVKRLEKIYVLTHVHKFNKKSECFHNHENIKLIGIFYSKDKVLNLIEQYKKLEGFRDQPDGFCIKAYLLDEINNSNLNELLKNKKNGKYSETK